MTRWADFLIKRPVQIVVVLLAMGALGAGVYGTLNVEEKFDMKQIAPDGSYFIKFQDVQRGHFPVGHTISIVLDNPDFDYTKVENQYAIMNLDNICKYNEYTSNLTINWMTALLNSPSFDKTQTFYQNLDQFLEDNPTYNTDLKFQKTDGVKSILYSRIVCFDKDIDDWIFFADSMISLREDLEKKSNVSGIFPISVHYYYRELTVSIASETIKNILICAGAILVITAPYLIHPMVILLVFGGFMSLIVELFGLMVIWNVDLNSITMIISISSIGFAVDYSAHVAHAYIHASGKSPEQRMVKALTSIGASVFMGGKIPCLRLP